MRSKLFVAGALVIMAAVSQLNASQWLHVKVETTGAENESVKVNVPLSLVETLVPLLEKEGIAKGKMKLDLDQYSVAELREIWNTLKTEGDFQLASIQNSDISVNISLEGGELIVVSDEESETRVDVRLPLEVVDALFSGGDDELDLKAALKALSTSQVDQIVSVRDQDTHVRVWIDDSSSSE